MRQNGVISQPETYSLSLQLFPVRGNSSQPTPARQSPARRVIQMEAVAVAHARNSSKQGPLVVVMRKHVVYAGDTSQISPVKLEATEEHRRDHESRNPRPRVFVVIPVLDVQ